jgi:uncharacterized Ntn-hydrolase superfamily protein
MTYSVCLRKETEAGMIFGVAVTTDAPAVGALAPCVSHHGAISTQSFVNVQLGRQGIQLLSDIAVDDALEGLLEQDDDSVLRQIHGVDARNNTYAFSGESCEEWFGHQVHEDRGITVAGNMLTGKETLTATVETIDTNTPNVVETLIDALAAGRDAGGDKRGHTSAAVAVKAPQTTAYHDLRVDYHDTPIAELRHVYEATRAASDEFSEDSKSRIFD